MNKMTDEERALFQVEHWNSQIKANQSEYEFIKTAVKKQSAKKPILAMITRDNLKLYNCPCCERKGHIFLTDKDKYCDCCGQALDWSD